MRSFYIYLLVISASLAMGCSKNDTAGSSPSSGTGTGGSLARFTVVGNHLYLANYSTLEIYDIADPAATFKTTSVNVGLRIETIFPYKDKLFLGSSDGMFIYSLANPANPVKLGSARHVRSCDPVVANDSVSYVTLRGGTACGPAQDGLYIYDIANITAPVQKALLPFSSPNGLGLKDTVVFVCRGANGLSAVNVKNSVAPKLMYTKTDANYTDVIPYGNMLICYVSTGLLFWDISDINNPVKVGTYFY
jgi:hypothetical protein